MSRNIFELKTLTKVYEQIKPTHNSIWNMLVGKEVEEKTQKFEIHTKSSGRLRAPLVGRREKGIFVEKGAFETSTLTPSQIKLYVVNEAEEMFEQKFGQTEYASPESAAKKELARELKELKEIAFRTKLWMLMTLLVTGSCPTPDGQGIKFSKNFTQEVLSGVDNFKNPDFDIVGYLEKKQTEIYKNTGITIDTIVVAPDVVPHILKNKAVIDDQKNFNSNLIQLSEKTETLSNGVKRVLFLPKLNLQIFSYIDWAKSIDDEEEKPLIPDGTLVGFKTKTFNFHYGALALRSKAGEKAKIHIQKEVIRAFYPADSEDDLLQYFSAPVVIPMDADGYFSAKVLG